MENPANWNATQKKISLALRATANDLLEERRKRAVINVIATLKANELLQPTSHNIEEIVANSITSWRDDISSGNFSQSLTSAIYNKLVDIGAIKKVVKKYHGRIFDDSSLD